MAPQRFGRFQSHRRIALTSATLGLPKQDVLHLLWGEPSRFGDRLPDPSVRCPCRTRQGLKTSALGPFGLRPDCAHPRGNARAFRERYRPCEQRQISLFRRSSIRALAAGASCGWSAFEAGEVAGRAMRGRLDWRRTKLRHRLTSSKHPMGNLSHHDLLYRQRLAATARRTIEAKERAAQVLTHRTTGGRSAVLWCADHPDLRLSHPMPSDRAGRQKTIRRDCARLSKEPSRCRPLGGPAGQLDRQPLGMHIYAPQSCAKNARSCREECLGRVSHSADWPAVIASLS